MAVCAPVQGKPLDGFHIIEGPGRHMEGILKISSMGIIYAVVFLGELLARWYVLGVFYRVCHVIARCAAKIIPISVDRLTSRRLTAPH